MDVELNTVLNKINENTAGLIVKPPENGKQRNLTIYIFYYVMLSINMTNIEMDRKLHRLLPFVNRPQNHYEH